MFSHAKAVDAVQKILSGLERMRLPLKLLLSLGMDGPNVKKSILKKLNGQKRERGLPLLLKCPSSCLIHVYHNSFYKGLMQCGSDAEDVKCFTQSFLVASVGTVLGLGIIEWRVKYSSSG